MSLATFLEEAAKVRPSQKQLDWFELGAYAFIHFGINTFTDREWGDGTEDPALFDPARLDCDAWVAAIKSAGLKGMILTAKHHDGFCLWPSAYTEHSVKHSPSGRDVAKEAAEACRRGGIKFGFYLSPWDRNCALYGTPEYNDFFCHQLTELLTGYGEIFCVWFDNACGEGPNGKKQVYDFPRYFEVIRKYQPNAVIFNDYGPDIRWCGNEAGVSRYAEWAVVPSELCHYSKVQSGPGPLFGQGDLSYLYNTDKAIGSLPMALFSKGLTFTPSEIDTSIRPGWFYHPDQRPHSLERLFQIYLSSWGANACLNLNIPPNREGLFDPEDIERLQELGELLRREFGAPLPIETTQKEEQGLYQAMYHLTPTKPWEELHYLVLEEDIAKGQRVETFRVLASYEGGVERVIYEGTAIGNRRVCPLRDPFADQNPLTDLRKSKAVQKLTVHITQARWQPELRDIRLY